MTYYHTSKHAAVDAGRDYATHFASRAELEPNNGWVLVLSPIRKDVFDYPLGPLLAVAELDLSMFARLRIRPESHKKSPRLASTDKPWMK
jgi:hypothetical protein